MFQEIGDYFLNISRKLVEKLEYHQPQYFKFKSNVEKNASFFVKEEEGNKFPLVFKVRPKKRRQMGPNCLPQPSDVFHVFLKFEKKESFTDANTNRECESRNRRIVYIYPHEPQGRSKKKIISRGRLCFQDLGNLDRECIILPKPPFMEHLNGTHRRGCLWIAEAEQGDNLHICKREDEVLNNEIVKVFLERAKKTQFFDAMRIELPGVTKQREDEETICCYDKRRDDSPVARVRYVRRDLIKESDGVKVKSFRFFELNSIDNSINTNTIRFKLTEKGLEKI